MHKTCFCVRDIQHLLLRCLSYVEPKLFRLLEAADAMVIETSFDVLIEVEWKCDERLNLVVFQAEESPSKLGERMFSIVIED